MHDEPLAPGSQIPHRARRYDRLGVAGLGAIAVLSLVAGLLLHRCWLDACSPSQFAGTGRLGDVWQVAALFALSTIVSHTIVVPNGTIVLLIGGYLLGGLVAGGIFYVTQVLMAPLVFLAGRAGYGAASDEKLKALAARLLPHSGQGTLAQMQQQGLLVAAMLRLAPVIPSGMSCLLAAGLGISLRHFMIATLSVSWMRPLACAAVGEAMRTASDAATSARGVGLTDLAPLALLFLAVSGLLAAKLIVTAQAKGQKPRP